MNSKEWSGAGGVRLFVRNTLRSRMALFVVGLHLLVAPIAAVAQPWSGILSPTRAIDWSAAGVQGGIPSRTTICATLNPGATAAQINSAIANCPTGQVVFLNAGTYTLNENLLFNNKSGVTLRGAGADLTKLVWSSNTVISSSCFGPNALVCLRNGEPNYVGAFSGGTANWTAGYAKGATVITLSNTTNITAGNMLWLDQLNDADGDGYPTSADIRVCSGGTDCTPKGTGGAGRAGRNQSQAVRVVAVNGNQVTISPGLHMPNWRASQSPGAWWGKTNIRNSGIENMTLDNTNSTSYGIVIMHDAIDCWMKGVRVINGDRSQVIMWQVSFSTIRDSYFYGSKHAESSSYGIETYHTSNNLYENNIHQHSTVPYNINSADSGSVYAYNYAIDDHFTGAPTPGSNPGWMIPMFEAHAAGQAMLLFEGNSGLGLQADNVWGSTQFFTMFRNHWFGDIYNNPPKDGNTSPLHIWKMNRFYNAIGNVLGRTGYYTVYECDPCDGDTSIYSLGDPDPGSGLSPDPRVKATLMRWGNYDTVNGSARFLAAEVPSGLANFANPVPQTQTLPPSLYLRGKPGFFGSTAWPAVGPDVTSGDVSGYAGHAQRIPARACYENTATDPAYGKANVRLFSAGKCYGSVGAPPAPTNLRLIS
jgi:hypothetical protein